MLHGTETGCLAPALSCTDSHVTLCKSLKSNCHLLSICRGSSPVLGRVYRHQFIPGGAHIRPQSSEGEEAFCLIYYLFITTFFTSIKSFFNCAMV